MNVIVRPDFEHVYYDVTVLHNGYFAEGTSNIKGSDEQQSLEKTYSTKTFLNN